MLKIVKSQNRKKNYVEKENMWEEMLFLIIFSERHAQKVALRCELHAPELLDIWSTSCWVRVFLGHILGHMMINVLKVAHNWLGGSQSSLRNSKSNPRSGSFFSMTVKSSKDELQAGVGLKHLCIF